MLTAASAQLSYGIISVDMPAVNLTGMAFLHDGCVDRVAEGTDCMTRMQVRLRTISLRYSRCLSEMDPLPTGSNIPMLSLLA